VKQIIYYNNLYTRIHDGFYRFANGYQIMHPATLISQMTYETKTGTRSVSGCANCSFQVPSMIAAKFQSWWGGGPCLPSESKARANFKALEVATSRDEAAATTTRSTASVFSAKLCT